MTRTSLPSLAKSSVLPAPTSPPALVISHLPTIFLAKSSLSLSSATAAGPLRPNTNPPSRSPNSVLIATPSGMCPGRPTGGPRRERGDATTAARAGEVTARSRRGGRLRGGGPGEHVAHGGDDVGHVRQAADAGGPAGEWLRHRGDDPQRLAPVVDLGDELGLVEVGGDVAGPGVGGQAPQVPAGERV